MSAGGRSSPPSKAELGGCLEGAAQALLDLLPDGLLVVDPCGRIVWANARVEALFGHPRHALLGEPIAKVLPDGCAEGSVRGRCRDGKEIECEARIAAVQWDGARCTLMVLREVPAQRERERRLAAYLEEVHDLVFTLDERGRITYVNRAVCERFGYAADELLGRSPLEFVAPEQRDEAAQALARLFQDQTIESLRVRARAHDGREIVLEVRGRILKRNGRVSGTFHIARDVTRQVQAEEKLRQLSNAVEQASDAVFITDRRGVIQYANPAMERMSGYAREELLGATPRLFKSDRHEAAFYRQLWRTVLRGETFRATLVNRRKDGGLFHVDEVITPLRDERGEITHFVATWRDVTDRVQAEERLREAARRQERLLGVAERRLRHLRALSEIDAITLGSTDADTALGAILDRLRIELKADAAEVFFREPATQRLRYAAARGFRAGTRMLKERLHLGLGEGLAGRVALEHRSLWVSDLAHEDALKDFRLRPDIRRWIAAEGLRAYVGVPLEARGELLGVLGIFRRRPLSGPPSAEWLEFAETLARRVALALDHVRLLEDLRRKHEELQRAYDATLEGWVRALDLRDRETEGHTQRVTELAVRLARGLGVPEEELVHVRRGALLHDIGKMAIPDRVLRKPGRLTEAEWALMKRHPVYAYRWLKEIDYLRRALEIPYCHHERWDGTGYPRGLKGEEIPLSARIFAVVDAWDAMTHDRPYRKALSEEEAVEELRRNAGRQFDPRVVEAFLALRERERLPTDDGSKG